jgi:hypothetical protein
MKANIKALLAYLTGPAFNFLIHWGATALVALGLHFGFHISVPVIPTTVTVFVALAFLRKVLGELAHAWHSGRLVAEAEVVARQSGTQFIKDLFASLEGQAA